MKDIIFVTSNVGKVLEVERFLGVPIRHQALDIEELQSLDADAVVRAKAETAFGVLQEACLVEDTSVTFYALNRLPGTFIKYFEEELGQEGLCRLLDGKDRACTTTTRFAFHDGTNIEIFKGSMHGVVSDTPRGTRSFGWASIVIPDGALKTYAEMSDEEQGAVSMRRKALAIFRASLTNSV